MKSQSHTQLAMYLFLETLSSTLDSWPDIYSPLQRESVYFEYANFAHKLIDSTGLLVSCGKMNSNLISISLTPSLKEKMKKKQNIFLLLRGIYLFGEAFNSYIS